ncbi:MAG TPA: hypothetical protein VNK24_08710 [Elusimicrobiota bacterium]|nr:hypothetical protein [Elusimicrobiota bacterium]
MNIALGLFALGAVTGLFLAVQHFRGQALSWGAALAHGAFGASGLVLLAWALFKTGFAGLGAISLAVFVVAALGGFGLVSFHLRGKRLPSAVVVIHALAAVAAFAMLVAVVFRLA